MDTRDHSGAPRRLCLFDEGLVRRWAEFSGDWNPIHFSPAHAVRFGLDGPVAHGMLVLLPMQAAASQALPAGAPDAWYQLKAFFRKPVPIGASCFLDSEPGERGVQFSVNAAANTFLRGSYGGVNPPRVPGHTGATEQPDQPWQVLPAHTLQSRYQDFRRILAGDPMPRWSFLTALVFAQYLSTQLGRDVSHFAAGADETVWPAEHLRRWSERDDMMVMQTALVVRHAASLRELSQDAWSGHAPVHWRRTSLTGIHASDELIGAIGLELTTRPPALASQPELQLEISLVARKLAKRPDLATA